MGYSKIIITGNLTKDPELSHTAQGTPVCKLSVAVNNNYVKNGEKVSKVTFWNVVFWNKSGEAVARFFTKGKPILVEGRAESRSYEDQQGQKRTVYEITGEKFEFIGGGRGSESADDNSAPGESGGEGENYDTDDSDAVPF